MRWLDWTTGWWTKEEKDIKTTEVDVVKDSSVTEEKSKIDIKTNGIYTIPSLSQIDNWLQKWDITTSYVNNIIWNYKKIVEGWKSVDLWQIKNDLSTMYKNPDIRKKILSNPDLIKYIKTLPLEKKKDLIKTVAPATLDFSERNDFAKNIFDTPQERKNFIKSLINTAEKKTDDKIKQEIRQYLANYFLVYELINTFEPTYTWDTGNAEENRKTRQFFLRRAWIQEPYEDSIKHNEKIRDWFLDVMMGVSRIEKAVNNMLDPYHQKYLEDFYIKKVKAKQEDIIKNSLSVLDVDTITKINTLSKEDFESFLTRLLEDTKEKTRSWKNDFSLKEKPARILWLSVAISNAHKEIDDILLKNNISTEVSSEEVISATEGVFIKSLNKQEQENYYKNRKVILDDFWEVTRILIEKEWEEQVIFDKEDPKNRTIELTIKTTRARALNNPEINRQLDKIEEKLITEYRKAGKEDELKTIRWTEHYAQVEQRYIQQQTQVAEKYQSGNSWAELRNIWEKLISQPEFTDFFSTNKIDHKDLQGSLSDEEFLDLLSKDEDKKQENGQEIKENNLLDLTNTEVKNRFVERVTYFLGNVLDIQIDKDGKENILKWLHIDEKNIDKNIITIEGKYQNTTLNFTYNIQTGELFTGKWLHKEENSQATVVGQKMEKLNTVSWPTFWEHFTQAKSISYADTLKKTNGNPEDFGKEIKKQLLIKCPLPDQSDFFKEEMQLRNLKNIVAQEMFEMIGIKDKQRPAGWIDGSKNPLFPLIARSIETYNKDELLQMRTMITSMIDFSKTQRQLQEQPNQFIDEKLTDLEKETMDDKYKEIKNITNWLFFLRDQEKSNPNYIGNPFKDFFMSFLSDSPKTKENEKIIDISKLYTYTEDLTQTKNKMVDKKYFEVLEENMTHSLADVNFQKQINIS